MIRIDAHHHFWSLERGDYGWLTEERHPAIYRDFLPSALAPLLREAAIDKTILVQAAPSEAETHFLLGIAHSTDFVAGVVGWTRLEAPRAPNAIARLAQDDLLVGLRPMLQDLPDDDWINSPSLAPAIDTVIRIGLRFDALVKPRHLGPLMRFLERNPDLRIVIDHGAKPSLMNADLAAWAANMRRIGKATTAFCKLSGLATEAGANWSAATLAPAVDVLLEAFGPSRLMWGSDWPVLLEAGDYVAWYNAANDLTRQLTLDERNQVFGGSSAAFYGIGERVD